MAGPDLDTLSGLMDEAECFAWCGGTAGPMASAVPPAAAVR